MREAAPAYLAAYLDGDYREAGRQGAKFTEGFVTTIGILAGGAGLGKAALKRGGNMVKKVMPKLRATPQSGTFPTMPATPIRKPTGILSKEGSDTFLRKVQERAYEAKKISNQNTAIKEGYEKMADIYQKATAKLNSDGTGTRTDPGVEDTDRLTLTGRVVKTPEDLEITGSRDGTKKQP